MAPTPTPAPDGPGATRPADPLLDALEQLASLALVHDRGDLAEAAQGAVARVRSARLRVVVFGEYKKGKSSLINALLDAPICAVDDDIATAARLEVVHADRPAARWWRWRSVDRDPADAVNPAEVRTVDSALPVEEAAAASTQSSTVLVRAGLPRGLLRSGVVLVDTPGVGGIRSAEAVVTASSLADAHVALFVTDCTQELTAPELAALRDAIDRGPHVVVVEAKTDMSAHWREIVEADRDHLRAAGIDVPVVAVSSALRLRALRSDDRGLNEESGFSTLVRLLADEYVPETRSLAERAALRTARRVYALLHEPLVTEYRALEAAGDDGDASAPLEDAKQRVAEFKIIAGKWQQLLNDGTTDLVAAVDNDLRTRFRELVRDCEEELADIDPDDVWDTFEPALYRTTAEALDANLALLREQSNDLALRLAEHLEDGLPGEPSDLLADALADDGPAELTADRKDGNETSTGARAHNAFRAGYGGAMPIMAVGGMALGVLGLGTLVLPLAAVAGVVAGRKALTDEKERQLDRRRQQAKTAVKRYADDVQLRAMNERKSIQRRVQRTLRDHFSARVKEIAVSHGETVRALEAAVTADSDQRRRRMAELRDEVGRVEQVANDLQRRLDARAQARSATAATTAGGDGDARCGTENPAGAAV